ncbi:hypothetical protein QP028_07505 [Corynebacterium suedekumii]|nr:hypothetical protein QP028_07505 [Corynebacterium suedekumii]
MIATLLPPVVALTNKAPYLYRREGSPAAEAYLLGILSSIPLDWYARKYVELGMNLHILNGLPIPVYDPESESCNRVAHIAGRLAAIDEGYSEWANEVGVSVGSVTSQAEKDDLIAEIDAIVSSLYGLSEDQIEHLFATFHRGWNYQQRLEAVLEHYAQWKRTSVTQLPDFATNHQAGEATDRVADRLNELFRLLRDNKVTPPPLAIATAYINPGGFGLLADELERALESGCCLVQSRIKMRCG